MRQSAVSLGQELRSSFWLASMQVSRIVAGFLVGVIVVRYLGAEQYGALMLALSISGFFAAFGSLGLPRVVLKELSMPRIDGRSLVATAILLQVAGGVVGVLGTWLVCMMLDTPDNITAMALVFALALIFAGGTILQQLFLSVHKTRHSAWANILGIFGALGYRISLVAASAQVHTFAFANLIQNTLFLVVSFAWARPLLHRLSGSLRPERATARLLLAATGPLFLASLLQSVPLHSDRVVMAEYLRLADIGLYAVLIQLVAIPQMLVRSFIVAASPRLVRVLAGMNNNVGAKQVVETLSVATAGGVVLLLGLGLIAPVIVPLIYGPEFQVDYPLIALICAGMLAIIPNTLRAEFLLVRSRQDIVIWIAMIHAIATVAMQVLLIARFGLLGAAAAYFLQSLLFAALLNHLFPVLSPYRTLYWRAFAKGLTLVPLIFYLRALIKSNTERENRDDL